MTIDLIGTLVFGGIVYFVWTVIREEVMGSIRKAREERKRYSDNRRGY